MSDQDIQAFRTLVNDNEGLRAEFFDAFQKGPAALAAMARQHGFETSEAQVVAALNGVEARGELTDAELELVSASAAMSFKGGIRAEMEGTNEFIREGDGGS